MVCTGACVYICSSNSTGACNPLAPCNESWILYYDYYYNVLVTYYVNRYNLIDLCPESYMHVLYTKLKQCFASLQDISWFSCIFFNWKAHSESLTIWYQIIVWPNFQDIISGLFCSNALHSSISCIGKMLTSDFFYNLVTALILCWVKSNSLQKNILRKKYIYEN